MKQLSGIEIIAAERAEHTQKHGYGSDHDTIHNHGELAIVAATLAVISTESRVTCPEDLWGSGRNPWGLEEKLKGDRIHGLAVAGSLIAAEIDRLQFIEWDTSGEIIESHDSECVMRAATGINGAGKKFTATAIYQHDEFIELQDIEEID